MQSLASDTPMLHKKLKFLKGMIIVIEGNIASGKSTLTQRMSLFLTNLGFDVKLYKEPILQSYLDQFLTNQPKYAFGFQMSMLIENQCMYADAVEFVKSGGIAIMDRSFNGNRVFALLQHENGNISDKEMEIYDDVFKRMNFPSADYTLYLQVDPSTNAQRCNRRARSCETSVYTPSYFEGLNRVYNQVIQQIASTSTVIAFDWNQDIPDEDYQDAIIAVLDSIRQNYLSL